jgi:hypothetical protein
MGARTGEGRVAIERLKLREEQRDALRSVSDDERSELIDREARVRVGAPPSSHPAPAKFFLGVLNSKPSAGAVIVAIAIIAAVVYAIGRGLKVF